MRRLFLGSHVPPRPPSHPCCNRPSRDRIDRRDLLALGVLITSRTTAGPPRCQLSVRLGANRPSPPPTSSFRTAIRCGRWPPPLLRASSTLTCRSEAYARCSRCGTDKASKATPETVSVVRMILRVRLRCTRLSGTAPQSVSAVRLRPLAPELKELLTGGTRERVPPP
jgi:hypothetical protein